MFSGKKLALAGGGAALLALVGLGIGFYGAWRHVPRFYDEALTIDAADAAHASDELLEQASALASDARQAGQWQALFTDRQINGWLATDLPQNHASLLPPDMHEPRVLVDEGGLTLACRMGEAAAATVCSMRLEIQVIEPNTLAVRIRHVRAGLLPVPMKDILEGVSEQARAAQIPLEWRQQSGDPLAIIKLPPPRDGDTLLSVERVELHRGEIFLTGKTEPAPTESTAESDGHERPSISLGHFLLGTKTTQ